MSQRNLDDEIQRDIKVADEMDSAIDVKKILNLIEDLAKEEIPLLTSNNSKPEARLAEFNIDKQITQYKTPFPVDIVISTGESSVQSNGVCNWKAFYIFSYNSEDGIRELTHGFGCDITFPKARSISFTNEQYSLLFEDESKLIFQSNPHAPVQD